MSRIELARRAIRHYSNDMVPLSVNKHNRRQWLRSVQLLGPRWVLALPVKKLNSERTT